ncbi:MAG TPA: SpoIIE family protein phosphatase [Ignavibacteria bacterium]|nr:SpoIIE family protein phosphatase [Ignavibacteria bacterium]
MKTKKSGSKISEMESLIAEMNYVNKISRSISENKPLNVLLNEIMESCKIVMNAEASSLMIYEEKENKLVFRVATGGKGDIVKLISIDLGEGIAGWVALHKEPLLIEDCYKDPRFNPEFDKKSNFKTKCMICVPMIHREKLVGVIQVINKKDDQTFSERDLNIFNILASQCAISIENAKLVHVQIQQEALNRELIIARDIQQNLLPSSIPKIKNIEISATLIPAKQVGGDYYNFYKLNENETLFLICDVSGKSISAALIVSTIYSSIVTYFELNKNSFDLKDFVKCLNRVLIESTTSEKFATCWFGIINSESKKIQSINAGHNTTYVFKKDKTLIELKTGGLFLGCIDMEFESEEVQMESGDVLFYYTDGVPEAMNLDLEQYTDERLIKTVQENIDSDSEGIMKAVFNDVKSFVKDADQSDDITIGAVKVL